MQISWSQVKSQLELSLAQLSPSLFFVDFSVKDLSDLLWHSLTSCYFFVLSMIPLNNLTPFSLFPSLRTPSEGIIYILLYLMCFVYFYLYFYFLYNTQYNWDWWGTFVITGLAGKEASKLKRSHQIQLLSNQQTMIFSCQSVPTISLQGVSKRSSDCFLFIPQPLKNSQIKFRAFCNSPFRGLLKNIQKSDVWVKIWEDSYKIVRTRENGIYRKCEILTTNPSLFLTDIFRYCIDYFNTDEQYKMIIIPKCFCILKENFLLKEKLLLIIKNECMYALGVFKKLKVGFKINILVFPSTWHVRSHHKKIKSSRPRPTKTPSTG